MTTTDTAAVRAWARENGYDVADRGRLPAEISDAYVAAHGTAAANGKPAKSTGTGGKAGARAGSKPAAKPARTTSKASTPAKGAATGAASGEPEERPAEPAPRAADQASPAAKPSPVADDRRLVALGEQLAALTERVERLEKAAGGGKEKDKSGRTSRFRRRS